MDAIVVEGLCKRYKELHLGAEQADEQPGGHEHGDDGKADRGRAEDTDRSGLVGHGGEQSGFSRGAGGNSV